jgi:hypothetical protein
VTALAANRLAAELRSGSDADQQGFRMLWRHRIVTAAHEYTAAHGDVSVNTMCKDYADEAEMPQAGRQ